MAKTKPGKSGPSWRIRREVTIGALLHLAILLGLLATAWTDLQKDMTLIQYRLAELVAGVRQVQEQAVELRGMAQEHEYRLRMLERGRPAPGGTAEDGEGEERKVWEL